MSDPIRRTPQKAQDATAPNPPLDVVPATPSAAAGILRDDKGRLVKGTAPLPGAGRPVGSKRVPICNAAAKLVEGQGLTLDGAVQEVLRALMAAAGRGDVSACRLLLEHLGKNEEQEAAEQAAQQPAESQGPEPTTLDGWADWLKRMADYQEQFDTEFPDTSPEAGSHRWRLLQLQAEYLITLRKAEEAAAAAAAER